MMGPGQIREASRSAAASARALGNYPLILITESQKMRGTDLRAENKGICLVIAKPFETERDL